MDTIGDCGGGAGRPDAYLVILVGVFAPSFHVDEGAKFGDLV